MFEYDQFNIAPWGGELALYFFLIGLAAMTFVLAAAPRVFGGAAGALAPAQRPASVIAIVVAVICIALLIMDLGQPGRFFYPILYFRVSSPLSWGAVLVPLFILAMLGFAYAVRKGAERSAAITGVVGSLLALSMPLYTGIDLMANQAREVWQTPMIPILFVTLSVTSGAAVIAMLMMFREGASDAAKLLRMVLLFSVGATALLFFLEVVALTYGSAEEQQAWAAINTDFSFGFWILTLIVGILAPLALLLTPGIGGRLPVVAIAGALGAVGAFSFREVLLFAGQIPQLYY